MIPSYLASTYELRVNQARKEAAQLFDQFQLERMFDSHCVYCGRACKTETPDDDTCRACFIDGYAEMAGEDLAERMGVC
jgi:hypothetical protein